MQNAGKKGDDRDHIRMTDTPTTNICASRNAPDSTRDLIGAKLRTFYDDVALEPVPVHLIELLRRLENKEAGH